MALFKYICSNFNSKKCYLYSFSVLRSKRAATARPERIWDYAVIPYEIETNFSGNHKALFKQVR